MTPEEIKILAEEIAVRVVAHLEFPRGIDSPPAPTFIRRLTVRQFANVIERGEEYVRRRIRARIIPRNEVNGPPFLIMPQALSRFGVDPELAMIRLAHLEATYKKKFI